ncbi:MAG: UvrD-helicase domain-containing protein, partial [Deltaproteobacteria bacterium]|nr:UvrD-helicase domain-containing protein [Deltaproteobacteria bacterium]
MNNFDLINTPLSGINLIEASAGTGKTYAITGLLLRLILEKGMLIDQILVVVFGMIMLCTGVSTYLGLSLILANM